MSPLEIAAVVFAIAYLVFAIRQNVLCWPSALVSVILSLFVLYEARLYMDAALQVFYAAMAVYGWHQWLYGGRDHSGVKVGSWPLHFHVIALVMIFAIGLALGWAMSHTEAAFPYTDSLTSVAAIVTTYMVARKILENWYYWFVIDAVSVYLYYARELYLFAGLFVTYLVLIVIGFRAWQADMRRQRETALAGQPV
jgi:nicotinamide mononucleotide transporter